MSKKKIIFSHPVLKDLVLTKEEAERLEALEKVNPSGWVRESNEEELDSSNGDSDNSNDSDDAVRSSTDTGDSKGTPNKKSKASTKGGKSRK